MEFCLGFLWGVRVPSLKLTQPTKIPIEIMVNIFKMVDVPWRFVRFPGGSTGRIGVFFLQMKNYLTLKIMYHLELQGQPVFFMVVSTGPG